MSESQSRYSIVERLTKEKLSIITAKSQVAGDIKAKGQEVIEAESKLSEWEKSSKEAIKRDRERHHRESNTTNTKGTTGCLERYMS